MKNKKGNVAVIAIIIVIVAISTGVIGWMFAKKAQAPEQKELTAQAALYGQKQKTSSLQSLTGDFGPYLYEKASGANVAVSDNIRAIAYYEGENGYVIANDKKFGPYEGMNLQSLQVSANFWGISITERIPVGGNVKDSKKAVIINGEKFDIGSNTDNVEFFLSDDKNLWGIRYSDMSNGGYEKFIINGKPSTENDYTNLTKIASYQKTGDQGDNNYYVRVDGKEYQIGTIDDQDAYFAKCLSYSKNRWGCSVGKKDGAWHIFIYDNGVKKEYGPYGKFADPEGISEFKIASNGFIFCSSRLAVVNKDGTEKKYIGQNIYSCNYSGENFGFIHANDKNKSNSSVNINGNEYGSYSSIDNFSLTSFGWGFAGYTSKMDKKDYIVNGDTVSDINIVAGPSISNNYWAVAYEKDEKLFMRVGNNKN